VTRIILGSASPRRRELLSAAGIAFDVERPDVDESLPLGIDPTEAARLLAERKARAIVGRVPADRIVLAADTIVAVDVAGTWQLLGKAEDEQEAAEMLRLLSRARHQVVTGVCALSAHPGAAPHVGSERTWVSMRAITSAEIAAYVASGEWRDKAGGYAIQESADRFVVGLEEGGIDNVVGLPVGLALELLRAAGALVQRDPLG